MSVARVLFAATVVAGLVTATGAVAEALFVPERSRVRPAPLIATPVPAAPAAGTGDLGASALGLYTPPACTGLFADVACPGGFAVNWIEQFALDGITAGCGGGNYCPDNPVTRAQMAVFVEKAMRGTANWPAHTQIVWAVRNADGTPNPTASGTALLNALAAIPTSGNDAPASNNPWLVKIGPGVFNLGTSSLNMINSVDIEGSGPTTTVISGGGTANPVVLGPPYSAELRSLAVTHNGGATQAIALHTNSGWMTVKDCALYAQGGTGQNIGLWAYSGQPTVLRCVLSVDGNAGTSAYGLYATNGTQVQFGGGYVDARNGATLTAGVYASASGGAIVTGSTLYEVGVYTAYTDSGGYIDASFSKFLYGSSSGSVSCAAVVDGSNVFHASTCP